MDHHVSIILPTYNRAHFLPDCLDALLGQTVPASEIIVVNDGSTDSTIEALIPYRDKIVYLEKPNGGKASALNLGLSRAKGDYIWIMDDDDVALPDALKIHLKAFAEHPDADFTYSAYHHGLSGPGSNKIRITSNYEAFRGSSKSLFVSMALGPLDSTIGFMHQQGMLVKKKCYEIAGAFEKSIAGCEDFDMNLRLSRQFKGICIEQPTFIFRDHEGNRGPSSGRHSYEERAGIYKIFDQKIIKKMLITSVLSDYREKSTDLWLGSALVNRALIMARWNLHELAMKDLEELRRLVDLGEVPLNEDLLMGICSVEAMYRNKSRYTEANSVYRYMIGLLSYAGQGYDLRRFLSRYYYWRGMEKIRKGAVRELLYGVKRAVILLLPISRKLHTGVNEYEGV